MAVGDRAEKRFYGPTTLSASAGSPSTTTVPSSRQWTTKQFVFTNTSGAEALVYLSIGSPSTTANRVLSGLPIAANDVVIWDTALVLDAAETIQGYADRSGVNITIMGWEKEV